MNEYHSFGVSCLVINSHHCLDGWRPFFPWIFILLQRAQRLWRTSLTNARSSHPRFLPCRLLFADGIRVRRWCFFLCCDAILFFPPLPFAFRCERKSTWLKCVFLSSFKNLLLFKNCQKKSSDLIMKWTRLLHHAFVLHIVVSQRVEQTFGAFCWNLRGCWGAHQNRFLVNFLTHSLPRCFVVYYVMCYTLFELRLQYTVVSGLHNAFSGELYFHQELPFSTVGKDHIKCVWFLALSFVCWRPSSCTDLGNFSPSLICKYCCRGN